MQRLLQGLFGYWAVLIVLLAAPLSSVASRHGPVFALATPTNGKGGWSLDLGTMGRVGTIESGVMTRAMLTYGITQDVQISVSGPAVFSSAPLPPGRGLASFAQAENLLNRKYQIALGYPTPRTSYRAGMKYTWGRR